jgi:gluconokinase
MKEFVVLGVSGCGKSTVARALAERFGGEYLDADNFHPTANKAKMAAGIALTDEDRWPWLDALNGELRGRTGTDGWLFLACSALRDAYRERLRRGLPQLRFIYLRGTTELIGDRLEKRFGHFMPPELLESQFTTLEEPADAITVEIDKTPVEIVEEIVRLICRT